MKDTVRQVIGGALKEAGVDDPKLRRKAVDKVIKRLVEDKACVASWVAEIGVFKFIGYTNPKSKRADERKTISPLKITRYHIEAYVPNEGDEQ